MASPYLERPLRTLADAIADIENACALVKQGRPEIQKPAAKLSASLESTDGKEEGKGVTY